jgi:hypothetical protein
MLAKDASNFFMAPFSCKRIVSAYLSEQSIRPVMVVDRPFTLAVCSKARGVA